MQHIDISHQLLEKIENDKLVPVLVESPLAAPTIEGLVRNKKFARACLRDALGRGEAPYASHLLYAQEGLLNDDIAEERALGIHAGLVWGKLASKTVVYTDLGISSGMQRGMDRAVREGREVEHRVLGFVPEVLPEEVALEELRQKVVGLLKADETEVPNIRKSRMGL
jgi:hypothetical protein